MTSNHIPSQSPVSKVSKIGCNISVGQYRAEILQFKDGKGRVKKSREYNEFGTKGGGVSDLNHYFKQL